MLDETAKARVQAGIAYLDETSPNWREKFDWENFAVDSIYSCPIGQTFGDYTNHLNNLFPGRWDNSYSNLKAHQWAVTHGFDSGVDQWDGYASYGDLTDAWLELGRS